MSDESTADPDQDEPTTASTGYEPRVPSVARSIAVVVVFCVLATMNFYLAVKGAHQAAWAWRDAKDGVRRGWLP